MTPRGSTRSLWGRLRQGAESYAKSAIGAHAELCGNEAKDVQGNGLPRHQNTPRISKGVNLEREAQPVVSPTSHPDLLDVAVGQCVMAQQGGFVRGQVELGRTLVRAPDASSRHVLPLRYPFIPTGATLSVRGRPADGAVGRRDPRQTGARSVSYEWYGNNCGCGTLSVHFAP